MQLVRLNDLSEEERKKLLQRQEERNKQYRELAEQSRQQASINFDNDINNNPLPQNNGNLWDKVVNIANDTGKIGENAWLGLKTAYQGIQQNITDARKYQPLRFKMPNTYANLTEEQKKKLSPERLEAIKQTDEALNKFRDNQIAGLDQSIQDRQNKKVQYQNKMAQNTEDIENKVGKKLSELVPSISQMAIGLIPGAGGALFTSSAMRSYYDEGKNRGMDEEQAQLFSGIMGLAEGATEMIGLGNLKKAGKTAKAVLTGAGKTAVKEAGEQVGKATIKQALKEYGIGIADNAIQEAIIDPIQEITAGAIAGKDKAQWNDIGKNMLNDAINGGLISAILGGANLGIQSCTAVVENYKNGKQPTQQELTTAITDASKKLDTGAMIIDGVEQRVTKYGANNQMQQITPQANQNGLNMEPRANAMQNNLNKLNSIIENDKNIPTDTKVDYINTINELANDNSLTNDVVKDLIGQIKGISQENQVKNEKLALAKNKDAVFSSYLRDKKPYDNKMVKDIKEMVPANKQGRRTKEQWLQVAKQLGANIADKSNKEIERIAYKSWQEEIPNKADVLNRQGKKFVKFTSDEWVQAVYDEATKQRDKTGYKPVNNSVTELDNLVTEIDKVPEQVKPSIDTKEMDLVQSAKQYNLDAENESIKSIDNVLKKRGMKARFDESLFLDENGKNKTEVNAVWVSNKDSNGNVTREVVFNPKADTNKTIETVGMHELVHDLSETEEFKELSKLVLDKNKTREGYDNARANLEDIYSQVYDRNKADFKTLVDEEELADTLGQKLTDQEFINGLSKEKPTVFKKVYNWVVEKLNNLTGGKVEKLYWENIKNKFENAYRQDYKAKDNSKYSVTMKEIADLIESRNLYEQRADKLQKAGDENWVYMQNKAMELNDKIEELKKQMIEENKSYSVSEEPLDKQIEKLKEEKSKYSLFSKEGREISKKINELQTKIDEEKFFKLSIKDLEKIDNGDYSKPDGGKYTFAEITDAFAVLQAKKNGLNSIKEWEEFAKQNQKNIEQDRLQKAEQEKQKKLKAEQDKKAKLEKEIKEADPYKLAQYNKIQKYNPMFDDEHVGIRSPADIKTFAETINDKEGFGWGDFSKEDAQEALDKNRITIYSSYPIKQGVFVSTSKIQAEEYAGGPGNQVYSLTVRPNNVAWINGDEGQFAKISQTEQDKIERAKRLPKKDIKYSVSEQKDNKGRILTKEQQEYFKDSKVRDANGNLLEVYHGTPTGGFNIYDKSKLGSTTQAKDATSGFHFTDNTDLAQGFAEFLPESWIDEAQQEVFKKHDYKYKNIFQIPQNEQAQIEQEIQEILDKRIKSNNSEVKKQYLDIKNPITLDFSNQENQDQMISDILYATIGTEDITEINEEFESNQDFIDMLNANFNNELGELKDMLSTPDAIEKLKDRGYDGFIFPIQKTDVEGLAKNQKNIDGKEYIVFEPEQIKNVDNANPTSNPDIRKSLGNKGKWNEFLNTQIGKQKGNKVKDLRLPTNNNVNAYNVLYQDNKKELQNIPVAEGGKVRKTYTSIISSVNQSPEAKAIAKELIGNDTYIPDSNKNQLQRADNRIERNGINKESETLAVKVQNGDKITAEDIATGERLIEYYSKTGEKEKLQDTIQNVALAGTQLGQAVQAMSLISKQTPIGQAVYIEKVINKMNADIDKQTNGKGQKFDFTADMKDKILNSSKDNLEQNIDEVARELGQQVPRRTIEKVDAWRYFSMLANPRTHIRNIVGNTAMGKLQGVKNKIAGGIEAVAEKSGLINERTKSVIPASKEAKEFAKNDVNNVMDRLNNESKFDTKNLIQQYQRTFKSNFLENTLGKAFNLNSKALELEDVVGLKGAYKKALADYMTANKLKPSDLTQDTREAKTKLENARKYAIQQAQEATFHQASSLSSWLAQFENKNKFTKLMTGAILPFKKTPINVAKTGIDYSPIGLAKAFTTDLSKLHKGDITATQYIDNISKGLTGTGVAVLGYALANAGILSASRTDDDDKKNKFEADRGEQPFALTIGNKTYSLDWLAPSAIPLFIGAELNQNTKMKGKEQSQADVLERLGNSLDAMTKSLNPMVEMSMLSGLAGALKSFAQDETQFFSNLAINSGKSYVNQFVPTIAGQLARTLDTKERSTTSTKKNPLAKAIDSTSKQMLSKIPIANKKLPVRTDVWGQDIKQDKNIGKRALQQFIFPWREKSLKANSVDNAISDLYDKTGEKSVLPNTYISKDFTINGDKYRMTAEEYSKYKKDYGTTSYNLLENLTKSKEYKNMSDEQKQKSIEEIYKFANENNKVNYAKSHGKVVEKPSSSYKTIKAIEKQGGSKADYFKFIGQTEGIKDSSEKINTLRNNNMEEKSKKAIYQNTIGSTDKNYNQVLSKMNINIDSYLDYKKQAFDSEKIDDGTFTGKSVTNSKKNKVYSYVNNMDITRNQKIALLGSQYKLNNNEQEELYSIISGLPNVTKEERLEIFKQYGSNFKVYRDGRVYYK